MCESSRVTQCHAKSRNVTGYQTMSDNVTQCPTISHNVKQCYRMSDTTCVYCIDELECESSSVTEYNTVSDSVRQCHTVSHSVTQCHTVSHSVTQCQMASVRCYLCIDELMCESSSCSTQAGPHPEDPMQPPPFLRYSAHGEDHSEGEWKR